MPQPTCPTTATREASGMAKLMLEEKESPIQPRPPEGGKTGELGNGRPLQGHLWGLEIQKPKPPGGKGGHSGSHLLSTGGSVRDQLKEALFTLTLLLPASQWQKERCP